MGMDLYRVKDKAYFRWNKYQWKALLELAQRYGWEPLSTEKKDNPNWNGNYLQNEYQVVTDNDAESMAKALENGLPDIPEQEAIVDKTINPPVCAKINLSESMTQDDYLRILEVLPKNKMAVMGLFTDEVWETMNCFEKLAIAKNKIKTFIEYLRGGAFEIH